VTADAALTFLEFVEERHRIWERRQAGSPQPWTDNPILASHKFTNVYRWLDPGSQFVIEELQDLELSPSDNLMRFFLYRHTGRVETWEWLKLWLYEGVARPQAAGVHRCLPRVPAVRHAGN
jgi:alpha-glutamyl/putrescinyl thymine pyrophosphorylase clade 1